MCCWTNLLKQRISGREKVGCLHRAVAVVQECCVGDVRTAFTDLNGTCCAVRASKVLNGHVIYSQLDTAVGKNQVIPTIVRPRMPNLVLLFRS